MPLFTPGLAYHYSAKTGRWKGRTRGPGKTVAILQGDAWLRRRDQLLNQGFVRAGLDLFHGSPNPNITRGEGVMFFTTDQAVAKAYAEQRVFGTASFLNDKPSPTIYTATVRKGGQILDMRQPQHRKLYDKIRSRFNKRQSDRDYRLPGLNSGGFISSHTGLPSFGIVRQLKPLLQSKGFIGMYVDEGSQGTSLAIFNSRRNVTLRKAA